MVFTGSRGEVGHKEEVNILPAPTKLYRARASPPTTDSNKKLCSLSEATLRYAATGVSRSAGISIYTGTKLGFVLGEEVLEDDAGLEVDG